MNNPFQGCTPVLLQQVLDARELRAKRQTELCAIYGATLVSFSLNIPGEIKQYPLSEKAFKNGAEAIRRQFLRNDFKVLEEEIQNSAIGYTGFWMIDAAAQDVKQAMIVLEENHPLGRAFDIDVLTSKAVPLHGATLGRSERRCLICGGPVWACARNRTHSAEQLAWRTAELFEQYFQERCADEIERCAIQALLYEVSVTPKPGLVDRANNGSHQDMSFFTFMESTAALTTYFRKVALLALRSEYEPDELLQHARWLGQEAEDSMFAATGGVNTHKGAIFSLGVLCLAAGYLFRTGKKMSASALCTVSAKMAENTPCELVDTKGKTHGENVYAKTLLTGARGEAASGFAHAKLYGLPVLQKGVAEGLDINSAGILALLMLIAHTDDINIIYRAGQKVQHSIQKSACKVLEECGAHQILERAQAMDIEYIKRNLSPGGCADLLAVSFFLYFMPQVGL